MLRYKALRLKYPFIDRGTALRGLPYNLTLAWSIMPKVCRVWMCCGRGWPGPGAGGRVCQGAPCC